MLRILLWSGSCSNSGPDSSYSLARDYRSGHPAACWLVQPWEPPPSSNPRRVWRGLPGMEQNCISAKPANLGLGLTHLILHWRPAPFPSFPPSQGKGHPKAALVCDLCSSPELVSRAPLLCGPRLAVSPRPSRTHMLCQPFFRTSPARTGRVSPGQENRQSSCRQFLAAILLPSACSSVSVKRFALYLPLEFYTWVLSTLGGIFVVC